MIPRRSLLAAPLALPALARAEPAPLAVASFSILRDMVATIAGDAVRTASLVPPDGDPHALEPTPGMLALLRGAAIVVENGLGLEGWLERLVPASGFRGALVTASAGIEPRRLEEGGAAVPDPHVWQDPALGRRMVRTIADALAGAVPARADAIRAAADAYAAELRRLEQEIAGTIGRIAASRRTVLTTHDAFGYYGARFGIRFVAIEGLSTDAEPSPRALARIAAQAERDGTRTVFLETTADPRLAQTLAREARLSVGPRLYSDSLSGPDGPAPTYLDLLRYNTAQFAAAMAG